MSAFFQFLQNQWAGILVAALILVLLTALVHWLAWVFGRGRFDQPAPAKKDQLRYVVTNFFVEVINDFRHLLALVIILIFALALVNSLVLVWFVDDANRIDAIGKAMQGVVSTLGGLIGAIIGYYFGEKAAQRGFQGGAPPPAPPASTEPAAQPLPGPDGAGDAPSRDAAPSEPPGRLETRPGSPATAPDRAPPPDPASPAGSGEPNLPSADANGDLEENA